MIKELDNSAVSRRRRPVRLLQFGEGNFLRAFVDWQIDIANEKGVTDIGVAVMKPRVGKSGVIDTLNRQDCLYHVCLEGVENGKPKKDSRLITSVEKAFTPEDRESFDEVVLSSELRFVVSNTTEAGIRYEKDDVMSDIPETFPGKVTALLWKRFRHFGGDMSKGLFFICCELIEDNGTKLRECVIRHASDAGLGEEFISWVLSANIFVDTLVDRIVSGYPDNPAQAKEELGYEDNAIVKGELYHLWVIGGEGASRLREELPLDKAGLHVRFVPSVKEFRDRKVRILNGSHTGMVAMALLYGCRTVTDAFNNRDINAFVSNMVEKEVLPVIEGEISELHQFASGILERFYNPYVRHMLESISLNSLSKWEARNFDTVKDNWNKTGKLAVYELFSFASLLALYAPGSGFTPLDNQVHVDYIRNHWNDDDTEATVRSIVSASGIFLQDFEAVVPGFSAKAAGYVEDIRKDGIAFALKKFLGGSSMKRYIRINPSDNVGVVLDDKGLRKGEEITVGELSLSLSEDVSRGHKFSLANIRRGEQVIKYGYPIGVATDDIVAGSLVHSHNLGTGLDENLEYVYDPDDVCVPVSGESLVVNGFLRKDGNMGIRNELWIVPTVGCVNSQANAIAESVRKKYDLTGVDDVRAFTHSYGCSQLGQDHADTRTALAALARHPNAGGVLVLGLGCENNQISALREAMGDFDDSRVFFLAAQDVEDEIEAGVSLCGDLLERMRRDSRVPLPLSKLRVGLKCGGSDGLSGITANPLVGLFSDWLVSHGGTTILTEVPEMFGAETILMNRSVSKAVFNETVSLINNFKDYYRSCGQPIYENPSPGNKAGGITTLEEKSLGCVQKGGCMPVVDVLGYGEPVKVAGLNLLQAPGNDLVAASALALSGCQMVLFTTGRGTPFGTFVPTLKISTNSSLARKKSNWIDFNAGSIVENESQDEALRRLVDKVLSTAEGTKALNEKNGAKEIAIFKTGVTL